MGTQRSEGHKGTGTRHTPGPWIATDGPDPEIRTTDGTIICNQVCSGADDGPDNDGRTNAVLLAASPDLLAATVAAHRAIDILFARLCELDPDFYPSKSGAPWDAIRLANTAIAKAGGAA